MAVLHKDLIRNCGIETQFNRSGQLVYARYDRAFMVSEIDIGTNNPEMIQAVAVSTVKTEVPVNTPHPDEELALSTTYRAQAVESGNACEVIVSYSYNYNPSFLTTFTVECFTSLESVMTDVHYKDDESLGPISVGYWRNWKAPGTAKPNEIPLLGYAAVPALRPVGGLRISKTVSKVKADALMAARYQYLGGLNATALPDWGMDPLTAMVAGVNTTFQPYTGEYNAQIILAHKPQGWNEYARFSNAQYGTPSNIWRIPGDTYMQSTSNGIAPARVQPKVTVQTLLGLL